MNWDTMSKEQKQKVALAGLGGMIVLFATWQFVLSPWLAHTSTDRDDLVTLQAQLEQASLAVNTEALTDEKLAEAEKQLRGLAADSLPSSENPLSWVTRQIYTQARTVGVDIESVSEMGTTAGSTWDAKELAGYAFRPYGVQIATQCSFDQLCRFVKTLEDSNPYLGVLGISIAARDGSPEAHEISLVLEWPIWKDASKAPAAVPGGS